jgi:beta-lactamase regulating signal transducer with metallopeptidase domain
MADLPHYLPGPGTLLFLANLAGASLLVCGAGLLALGRCRSHPAPVRHGLLVTTLLLLLSTPLLTLTVALGWGGIPVRLAAEASTEDPTPPQPAPPIEAGRQPAQEAGSVPLGTAIVAKQASVVLGVSETLLVFVLEKAARELGVRPVLGFTGALLVFVWGAGVVALAFRLVRGLWTLTLLWKTLRAVRAPGLEKAAAEAFRALGVEHHVRVYLTPLALTPFSLGLVRPRIVLPVHLPEHLDAEELRYVLLHEAAHIHRRDHWVVLLQLCCATLFWWNPLVRAVNARLARLREQLCDDHVVSAGGNGRRFAEVLVRVAEQSASRPPAPCSAALLDEDAESLTERVRRLLQKKRTRPLQMSRGSRVAVSAFAVLVGLLLLAAGLRGADVPEPTSGPVRALVADAPAEGSRRGAANPATEPIKRQQVLSGTWQMHLPAGFKHKVTLTPAGPNRYRLEPRRLNSSGIYEVRGNRLVIVAPNDRRLLGFEWEIRQGRLILVGQPPTSKTGSNYLGATLVRQAQ